MAQQLALPAYEQVLKAGHSFNLLDARGAISVTERAAYIGRIRNLARSRGAELPRQPRAAGLPDGAAVPGPTKCWRSSPEEGERRRMNSTRNLLVELFVEELPPKALKKLGEAFAGTLAASLQGRRRLAGAAVGSHLLRVAAPPGRSCVGGGRAGGRQSVSQS